MTFTLNNSRFILWSGSGLTSLSLSILLVSPFLWMGHGSWVMAHVHHAYNTKLLNPKTLEMATHAFYGTPSSHYCSIVLGRVFGFMTMTQFL